jgi:hypothetical protein
MWNFNFKGSKLTREAKSLILLQSSLVNRNTFWKLKVFLGLKMHYQNIVEGQCFQKEFWKIFLVSKVDFPNFFHRYILNPFLNIPSWQQWHRDLNFGMCIKDPTNKTSGSRRPKNLRIRIRNTACYFNFWGAMQHLISDAQAERAHQFLARTLSAHISSWCAGQCTHQFLMRMLSMCKGPFQFGIFMLMLSIRIRNWSVWSWYASVPDS